MKNILKIFAVSGLLGLTSCEGFLDVEPTNSGDSVTAIKTADDAKVIMSGIMRRLTSSNHYGRDFIMYGDAKGGDMTIYSAGRGNDALYTFNHNPNANAYSGFWTVAYNNIMQVNNLLENIDKIQAEGSTQDFNSYKGQALTVRALIYFDLVRLYGKPYNMDKAALGVPNITATLPALAQPNRDKVEDNYNQILADLKAAETLLPKTKSNGFLNYYGNKALQARVNLYMEKYPDALAAAEDVITNGGYTLYTPANWVESWTKQFGSESIFELGVFPNEADLGTGSLGFYLRRRAHGASTALGWFGASDYFLERLNQDPTDVRWGVMAADEISTTANPRLGSLYKYSGNTALLGDGKSTATAVNIKVIRSSEVYLIAAEAALKAGNAEKAATYLNAIRRRSPGLAPATAATVSLDMILDERSKELFGEGHRFFDMIRNNKSITFNDEIIGTIINLRPKTIDRTYFKTILPIGIAEINANPGMGTQQNPGY
jgi:hypothetical protein